MFVRIGFFFGIGWLALRVAEKKEAAHFNAEFEKIERGEDTSEGTD